MRRKKVNKILSVLLLLLVVVVISIYYFSFRRNEQVRANAQSVAHTAEVIKISTQVELSAYDFVLATRDYIDLRTPDLKANMKEHQIKLAGTIDQLAKLEENDIDQPGMVDSIRLVVARIIRIAGTIDSIHLSTPSPRREKELNVLKAEMSIMLGQINKFSERLKEQEYIERDQRHSDGEKFMYWSKLILYAVLFVVLVLTLLILYRIRTEFSRQSASEQKFITLLEAAPDATIISNARGVITMANRQAEKLFGYTVKELVGLRVEMLIPEQFREGHSAKRTGFISQSKERGMGHGAEMMALRKDGKEVPVEISLSPIETKEGRLVAAAIRDITARKEAEAELSQLYTQVNLANEALYFTDENLIIKSWNHGAEVLYGYTAEEALGRQSVELLKTDLTAEEYKAALTAMTTEDYWSGEIRRSNKKGEIITIHSSLSAIRDPSKNVTGYLSVSYDVSAEKKLRDEVRYLANITEQMSEAVLSRNSGDRRIMSWNAGAEKLFGFSKPEALGKTVMDLGIVSFSPGEIIQIEKELIANGVWRSEKQFCRKDGSVFCGAVTANALWDQMDKLYSFIFLIKDITTEKLLTESYKRDNEILEGKVQLRTREISESEKQYRFLFENNPMPMWIFDLENFRFLHVNEMAIQKYGYSREEFRGMTLTDIRPEAEKERFRHFDHAWRMSSQDTNRGVWKHCKKSGENIDVEVIAHSVIYNNRKAKLVLLNDVTSRLKTERELVASEKKFRALIENSYDIIALLDANMSITYRSPSAIRITGWADEDMKKKDFVNEIVHPDDRDRVNEVVRNILNHPGVPVVIYYRSLHQNGLYIDVEGVIINLLHRDYIRSIVFNLRDVTEQKKAENLLLAREKRFRSLIENSADIINLMDENYQLIYRSPSARRVGGYEDEEVFGKDIRQRVHPLDRTHVQEKMSYLVTHPGESVEVLVRYQIKSGDYIWLEGTATNLLNDSSVNAIVFNYRDVSGRIFASEKLKESEERYRQTLDNMIEGVQIIGFDWKYIYVNNAVATQAHTTKDQLIGFTMTDFFSEIEHTEIYSLINRCFLERTPFHLENRFILPDGGELWAQLSIQPVPEGVFILSVDITEKIKAAAALREEQHKLASIAASSPGLIYSFQLKPDGSMSFPYASNAMEEMFGYGHELINKDVSSLLSYTVKEDRDLFVERMRYSAINMTPWSLEFRFHHPVKGMVWIEGNSIPTKEPDGTITWHGVIMDVTERKRIQEKINEQAAQLRTLSDNLPGVMIFQMAGKSFDERRFTYVSNEVTRLTGKTPEEIMADPYLLYNCILPEDIPLISLAEKNSFEQRTVFNEEVRFRTFTGEIKWLNIISTPRMTERGDFVWDGFHVDITDRMNAENVIRESEERYRTLVEQAFDGILFYDINGQILECNNSGANTMGYSRVEMLQLNLVDLFYPEDLEIRPLNIPQVADGNQVFDFRTMRKKDGTPVEVEWVTRLLPDGRMLGVGRDITNQMKALSQQNLLSAIVNSSDDAIISTNLNSIISSWNIGAEQIYGYTADEMKGCSLDNLLPPYVVNEEPEILAKIKDGDTVTQYETIHMRKDGTQIFVSITTSPLLDSNGTVTGSSKIIRDITQQKEDANRIWQSNERYEAVAKATSDAIWDFDYHTNKTFIAGTGYRDLFGYELVNEFSPPRFWEDRIHPEDIERVLKAMELAKKNTSVTQASQEYRFRRADGSWAYLNDRYFILRDAAGKPLRLLGAKQDITKRKEAEQELIQIAAEKQLLFDRLSVILNTLPASVALLDPKGVMVEVNDAWKNFADVNGFSGINYGVGTSYFTISTQSFGDNEQIGKDISAGVQAVLDGNLPQFEYEYSWHLTKLNRWFRIVVTPLKGREFNGVVVMHIDISEIRKLELERIESKIEEQKKVTEAMLKGQEKERNAIGIELHDNVNQILVGTKVLLSVVRDFPEKTSELIPSCIDNLSLAVQENRKIAHELVTPNLSDENLLKQITRLADTMLKNAGIQTYINAESLNEQLLSDEMKLALYRVAQEQCTNIIKYAGAEQVIISLATKKDNFFMRIADDGHGTDPKKVTHGIGLKNISSRLGVFSGTISIDTAPGQGFALEIEIPLTPAKTPEIPA